MRPGRAMLRPTRGNLGDDLPMSESATDYIDLERYPIDRLDGAAGRALVEDCRARMAAAGACVLEGFVAPGKLAALVEQAEALAPRAHLNANCTTTPYQETVEEGPDDRFGERHPRRRARNTSVHVVAYDLIPRHDGIRLIYEWDGLLGFLAAVLGVPRLFRYEDRLAGLNIAVNAPGDENGWHFDQCDFVSSILIREAEDGGRFLFAPNIRDGSNENYDAVARVLDGDPAGVAHLPIAAGALVLFKGRHSMHRVTPVGGTRPRLIALLGYDTKPGVLMDEASRLRRFGRVA